MMELLKPFWHPDATKFYDQALSAFNYKLSPLKKLYFLKTCEQFAIHRAVSSSLNRCGFLLTDSNYNSILNPEWEVAQLRWNSFIEGCRLLGIHNPIWDRVPWQISANADIFVPIIQPSSPGFQNRDECMEKQIILQLAKEYKDE